MASKLEYYSNLADRTAMMVSGSYQSWTSFLTTVGRLYKYPYHEQLMIYAQRPEATACADYHLWNDRMGRYIRGKGTGIALIDTSGTTPALKYVFDIADTGARKNSRTPFLFEFREEHETAVAAVLEEKYSAPNQHTISQQIENTIHNMLIEYWDDHRQDICDNIDGSYLADYDEYNIGVSFQNAAEVSATYAILSRCGLDPDSYFEHEDFLPVFDFNTPGSLGVLGAAVSQTSETVLRTIEVTIKRYEREKLTERSQNHEQPDLQNERRLPDSQSDPQRTESAASGQIRDDAQSVPAGASSGAVEQSDSDGEAVPPFAGSRTDSEGPAGTDDAGAGEGSRSDGSTESIRPDEVGGADELPESAGGGDYLLGADLQLIEEIPVTGEQISLFLPESEQIKRIDEAERVGKTPSAFSMPQNTIDHILRDCGNTAHHREFVSLEFMKQKSIHEIAKVLPEIYRGGYGLKDGAADVSAWFAEDGIHITPGRSAQYARTAQILSWEDAAVRIGQLLEVGFFASNVELVEAPGLERKRVAEKLVDIERDLIHGNGKVYLPTIAQAKGGGIPDEVERVKVLLQDADTCQIITKEYTDLLAAKKAGEQVSRFRIYEAEKTFTRLAELAMPRTTFHSDLPNILELFSFITDDEINAALSRGPAVSGGKERIYSFFREDHSAKEITSFLREQYGIGGHTGAIPSCFRSVIDYDGKGITITKPGCPRAELKWSKVAQHIQELVRSGRYITPEELSTFQEKQQAKEKEAANTSVSVWAYNGIKEAHPDDIVLFQMGDFYEMYGQDARTVAPFLNLTLTQRKLPTGGTIEMCGFRTYALENSINLLRSRFSLTVSSVKENEERNTYSLPKLEPPKDIEKPAKIDQTFEYRLLSRLDMDCKYFLGNGNRAERHLWAGNVPDQIAEMRKMYDRLVIKPEWITAEDIDSYERQMLAEPVTPEVKTPESLAERLVQLIQVFEPESYTQTFGISGSEVALVAQVNDALKDPEAVRHYLEVVDSYHDDTDIPELTAMIDGLKAELEALPQEAEKTVPTVKITQADVDAAIQKWNGDITSKHSVVRYMREHGQEQSTAAWLALEFGGDPKEPFHVTKEGSEDKVIPWSKIQVRIETLIEREKFYTEQEYDNMDDIDPIAIRERLADSGIVDGQLVDEEKLNNNTFIRQVMADVERIAAEEGLEEETENPPNHSAHSDNPIYPYSVNQSVYLENGAEFVIEGISDNHVKLLDHSLLYPITRVESVESFKQLMERYPQPQRTEQPIGVSDAELSDIPGDEPFDVVVERTLQEEAKSQPNYHATVESVFPAEKNNIPYDVVIEKLHFDDPEPTQVKAAPAPIPPAQNYHITDNNLGVGGAKEKFRRNMNAINLLHELEFEGRQATPEEQEVLAQYVGWGGLADAFDESKANWADEFLELYTTLSPEEYKAARGSTLNAHYTSPTVIKAMYDAIGNLGFQTGNILEPSMGVGNFFGMLPESMAHSRLYGVELDDLTGRIAKQLYPKANITISGFEKTDRKDFFDLAVGNVPFGQYQVNDPAFNKLGFSIHNYFFAKALDQLRPGGVLAFVTSRYTMDSKDTAVRRYLAERADLLGAIRLPNTAFKANAGTEVVSDIIFLQKRESPMEELPDWVSVVENQDGYLVNSYFDDNPHMILGEQTSESTRYGMDYTVIPSPNKELSDQLAEAVKHIHGTYQEAELPDLGEGEEIRETIPADPAVKNYSYTLVDGQVYYRENSIMAKPKLNATAMERVKGLIGLRECVKKLIDLQMDAGTPDFMIRNQQAELNELYDDFTAKYGLINDRGNRLAFSDDPSYYLLSSLEILDEDKKLERKADMFFKRTIREAQAVTSVETASEALAVSIAEHACVDMPYMAQLSGKTEEEIASELRGVIFRLPGSDDDNPQFVTADEYLSGNVRKKLEQAQEAAKVSPIFQDNVDALLKAQPKDLEASEIDVRLGATWIDKKYIQEFMMELLQPPYYMSRILKVNYSPFTAEWNIAGKGNISMSDVNAYTTYGTVDINAYAILENTLNLRDVKIYDTVEDPDGKERRVLNAKKTTLAQQKQQIIKDAFREWIWKDPERRQTLVKLYNEKFNADRPREYDGSHITFNGMNPEITLREHQRNAIAHILYGGNTLLAHEVGAGKTFEVVGAAMESKRLGLCTKSLIVVPNHLTEQWASEFLRLYPSANILVARKKDFEPARRKTFCSKIATGDYDAVIIGHSQFEKIPMSMARQQQMIQDQINEIEDGIMELKMSHAEKFTVKSLERTKKSLEARLEKLNSTKRKDDVVTFEQLGVDRLFVDEAHSYKNLFLYTKMQNVAGISTTDAQKSSDMYMKCQYMDEKTGGRGVVFATGTPISNSMTELYTMMRYLQSRTLAEKGWSHFDCWAAHFGETKTVNELAPEGKGYRTRTRFAKFYNLPELINIWKEAADVKTADQLHLPRPEPVYHTEVAQPTETQQELVEELSERAADVHTGTVDPRIDNMLKITSDGRKLGLDQRIINPNLPDEEGTKLNMCVSNILRIWKDGEADKLTQLVFCDISTPKAKDPKGKTLDNPTVHALEALDAADSSFTAYDDIRSKLIAGGIPAEQIAFIHDANTDVKKKELFAKVRSGQVRVLMGSTFKMGAGMNVQDRLVALHDLDCPWRPGDLEQRSGRIIRQGNRNKEVHIFRYVTESTFDAYLWQTVENKQKFISQIMTSKSPVRSCEDVDETALSYAEIKALCAGDSRIKEKMDLEIDVARLKVLKADFQSQHYRMEDQLLKYFPQEIAKIQGILTCLQADMKTAAEHPHPEEGFAGITIKGTAYTDKEQAGAALMEAVKEATNCDPVKIGTYRGFTLLVTLENFGKDYVLNMMGEVSHKVTLGNDPKGNIVRMENSLNDMDRLMKTGEAQIQNLHEQMDHAKAELGKTFPQEAELTEKQARLADLTAELNLDEHSKESQTKEKDSAPKRKPSVLERLKQPLPPSSTPSTKKDERRNDLDR